jgi:phosphatidate cytidylyltransferase
MLFKNLTPSMLLLLALFVETGFVVGGAAMHAANRRLEAQVKKARWLKFGTYFIITHCMIFAASWGPPVFPVVMIVLAVAGAFEIVRATSRTVFLWPLVPTAAYGIYFLSAAGTILFAAASRPGIAVYAYLIVCVLDAYSQLTGQLIGRHRFSANISPNKTIEGAAGGAVFAIATSLVFRFFAGFDFIHALGCGILLSCAGILGDILSSRYKRLCGIKDFSSLLPGQGGIIDRFNSFFAAATVFLVYKGFC